jgi:fluoride exporter
VQLALIAAGGALGAVSRYLVDGWVSAWTGGELPWGTFAVNVTGSFFLGVLFAVTLERQILPAEIRGPVMIGFIGAYTTFSTLMLESWRLWEDGAIGLALGNLVLSVGVGVVALFVGLTLGRAVA